MSPTGAAELNTRSLRRWTALSSGTLVALPDAELAGTEQVVRADLGDQDHTRVHRQRCPVLDVRGDLPQRARVVLPLVDIQLGETRLQLETLLKPAQC